MRIDIHHLWRYKPAAFEWIDPHVSIARDFTTIIPIGNPN